jgi:NADH/NAD ratio-sensing transcriptional regulator Rex
VETKDVVKVLLPINVILGDAVAAFDVPSDNKMRLAAAFDTAIPGPVGPVKPVVPVGPCAPVAPVSPVGPCAPIEPVKPVAP